MEMPVVRCSNCGKAIKINEAIMFMGKSYCSEKCHQASIQPQVDQNMQDGE